MNTIYNKYTVMIEKLINEIKAKYTSELGYFDKYKNWLTTYQTKIDKINKDIATMEAEISLKQDKLGEGSGSWSGRVVTSTETDLYVYGHCYWLGNNHEQYGGMLTGGGKDDMGGAYWSDGTPAHIDAIFGVDRGYEGTMPEGGTLEDRIDSTSPIELTEDNRHEIFEKLKEADANGTLEEVDQYWDGDLEEGSWKSLSSGTINKFRKKVTVIYKISYGTTTTTDL
jgi:hypothetical protein